MTPPYEPLALTREAVEALPGLTLLEFGTNWCSWCQGAQPSIASALGGFAGQQSLRHLKEEDGRGRPLGRAFGVKLWPTLIVLRDGQELGRVVRPADPHAVERLLALLHTSA